MTAFKHIALALFLGLAVSTTGSAQANTSINLPEMQRAALELVISQDQAIANLIDWKVGDVMIYNMTIANIKFLSGTQKKEVTSEMKTEEGDDAIWLTTTMTLFGFDLVTDVLMRRADGKILKIKQFGREVPLPEQTPPEIVDQKLTEITVPAGTFKAMYIKATSETLESLEAWVNGEETVMEGALKQILTPKLPIQLPISINFTFELTSFDRGD